MLECGLRAVVLHDKGVVWNYYAECTADSRRINTNQKNRNYLVPVDASEDVFAVAKKVVAKGGFFPFTYIAGTPNAPAAHEAGTGVIIGHSDAYFVIVAFPYRTAGAIYVSYRNNNWVKIN